MSVVTGFWSYAPIGFATFCVLLGGGQAIACFLRLRRRQMSARSYQAALKELREKHVVAAVELPLDEATDELVRNWFHMEQVDLLVRSLCALLVGIAIAAFLWLRARSLVVAIENELIWIEILVSVLFFKAGVALGGAIAQRPFTSSSPVHTGQATAPDSAAFYRPMWLFRINVAGGVASVVLTLLTIGSHVTSGNTSEYTNELFLSAYPWATGIVSLSIILLILMQASALRTASRSPVTLTRDAYLAARADEYVRRRIISDHFGYSWWYAFWAVMAQVPLVSFMNESLDSAVSIVIFVFMFLTMLTGFFIWMFTNSKLEPTLSPG